MDIGEILGRCKKNLAGYYGKRLAGLLLYGSQIRQQSDPESDIDLLVLLRGPMDYFHELHTIVELLYPVQLESDRLISAKPALVDDFEDGSIQLYRTAKREGMLV